MPTRSPQKQPKIRWTSLKGLVSIILFLLVAILIEYLVFLYALGLGTEDTSPWQSSFSFPGTGWSITLTISPLFHLVPMATILALVTSWIYLTRRIAATPKDTWKGKVGRGRKTESRIGRATKQFLSKLQSGLSKVKGFAYAGKKIKSARAPIRSALLVFLIFLFFVFVTSLLAYPQIIYHAVAEAYRNNPALLGFIKGTGEALTPVSKTLDGIFLSAASGFRDFVLSVGNTIKPLTSLNNEGKYLVFQNVAAWISAFTALFYVKYRQKDYRYKRK
jgi:hypothetical protein